MSYLRNCWYLGAWSSEVEAGKTLARTLLDEPVVFFRGADGRPVAMADRCPHRFAPLSVGVVQDGSLACRYHGLAFGPDGRCTVNPHGPITKGMAVRTYPTHEAYRGVWFWPGDPAKADPALLPDLSFLSDAPATAFSCGYLHSNAHYELSIDNVLDLSHTDFLHPDTLGGGAVTATKALVERLDDGIDIKWLTPGRKPAPLLAALFKDLQGDTDVWQEVRWWAPGIIRLKAGAGVAGRPREEGYENRNVHIMTPETAFSSHYLFAATRNFAVEDQALNDKIAAARLRIFSTEDSPIIDMIQQRMGTADFWDLKPLLLGVDAGPVLARRMLKKMIEDEAASPVALAG